MRTNDPKEMNAHEIRVYMSKAAELIAERREVQLLEAPAKIAEISRELGIPVYVQNDRGKATVGKAKHRARLQNEIQRIAGGPSVVFFA